MVFSLIAVVVVECCLLLLRAGYLLVEYLQHGVSIAIKSIQYLLFALRSRCGI